MISSPPHSHQQLCLHAFNMHDTRAYSHHPSKTTTNITIVTQLQPLAMIRLARLAQMRALSAAPLVRRHTVALKQPAFKPTLRFYSVPPKSHFQPGDTPPESNSSSASSDQGGSGTPPPPPPPPSGAAGRILITEPGSKVRFRTIVLLLAILSGCAAWLAYPRHTFSPEVATTLRKALKAESESFGGQNLPEAVKYYVEALVEAEAQGLSPLTDEYTGIQLKLAEIYELMENQGAANDVYMDICKTYMDALVNNKVSAEARPHCIHKALRVALKLTHHSKEQNWPSVAPNLEKVIDVAQSEVVSRCPKASDLMMVADVGAVDWKKHKAEMHKARAVAASMRASGDFDMWMPFKDELIAAREMLTTIKLAVAKTDEALCDKETTILIMRASGCPPPSILLTTANLASMLYQKAERAEELAYLTTQNKFDKETMAELVPDAGGPISADEIKHRSTLILKQSEKLYQQLLKSVIPAMDPEERRTRDVEEAQALCTYGLGVISIKTGELDKASGLLRETRARAMESGFDDMVLAADGELTKVDKLAAEVILNKESDKKSNKKPTVAEK